MFKEINANVANLNHFTNVNDVYTCSFDLILSINFNKEFLYKSCDVFKLTLKKNFVYVLLKCICLNCILYSLVESNEQV